MKILFSPSEQKTTRATDTNMKLLGGVEFRMEILKKYQNTVLLDDIKEKLSLFGLKKEQDAKKYLVDIFNTSTCKALQRYDGVAYDYLEYETLSKDAQEYLDENLLIFSNLFGVVQGKDLLPIYKVKQGNTVGGIAPQLFYKPHLKNLLGELLENEEVIDLRAGYYEKFYKHTNSYTTLKFLKNNKVVSHWAKAYRGIIAKEMAQNNIQTTKELLRLPLKNLQIKEIRQIQNKTEVIYEILS